MSGVKQLSELLLQHPLLLEVCAQLQVTNVTSGEGFFSVPLIAGTLLHESSVEAGAAS